MAKNTKIKLKDTLGDFLFNQIKNDPNYQVWSDDFEMPNYITDNLAHTLRNYQAEAVKHFIYLYESGQIDKAKHVLFNMATGTGKTLTMAAIVLYLYEWGYRNFIFLVHQIQIKDQATRNFTDSNFDKYLFKKSVKFNGKTIPIKAIERFQDGKSNGINFMFFSTQMLYGIIKNPKENTIDINDFTNNDTIIIADEAHRLNVDTRKKTSEWDKLDKDGVANWEKSIQSALHTNPKNLLLEFTATVDLNNESIHKKYQDKLVYKYDFLQFNKDGYSKQVGFLYNEETQIEDQKRLLIVNAVALSEYRRLFAKHEMNIDINPIVLIKSSNIDKSHNDRDFFHKVINSLRIGDFNHLIRMGENKQDLLDDSGLFIRQMFAWIADPKSGIASTGDLSGLQSFVNSIKERFSENNTMIYNSKSKEKAHLLPFLDYPQNTIRAIFSVNALNEGWDVLSLFDIVHFDISSTKAVNSQDIQLIGRGARLFPYNLPKSYKSDGGLFGNNYFEYDKFKRKFDNSPHERGRILETFYYHFVKTGTFLDNLQSQLLNEGIVNQGVEKRTIQLKEHFLQSQTYQKGFILVNKQEYRSKNNSDEINKTFRREIIADNYQLQAKVLTDTQRNQQAKNHLSRVISLTDEYFSYHLLRKALVVAENNFFRLNNLKKHIIDIQSIDEMINTYLPMYEIKYNYTKGKDIHELSADEKLQLLINAILPEVRKSIDKYMPQITGSKEFFAKPLSDIFSAHKNIYLVSYPIQDPKTGKKINIAPDERGKAQSNHDNHELNYDVKSAYWYAYSENYGTSEEKKFVKYIATQIDNLQQKYLGAEIYLLRNELDYWLFNPDDGKRFSPDYLMIINDINNKQIYYQCLFEPKGGHLLEKDKWKEDALVNLDNNIKIISGNTNDDYHKIIEDMNNQGYHQIKCLGFNFYNSDPDKENLFKKDFQNKLLSQ